MRERRFIDLWAMRIFNYAWMAYLMWSWWAAPYLSTVVLMAVQPFVIALNNATFELRRGTNALIRANRKTYAIINNRHSGARGEN